MAKAPKNAKVDVVMLFNARAFLLTIMSILALSSLTYSSSQPVTLSTNVNVNCEFSVTLNTNHTVYIQPTEAVLPYNVFTQNQCTIPALSGTLVVANSLTTHVYYSTSVILDNVGATPSTGNFTVGTGVLPQGQYTATLTLNDSFSNSSSVQFIVIPAANIIIDYVTADPSQVPQGTSVTLNTNMTNVGALASSNMELNIKVVQPNGSPFYANVPISSLSPSQSQIVSAGLNQVSQLTGTYVVYENVSYTTTYTYSGNTYTENLISPVATTTYLVPSTTTPGGHGISPITIPPPLPGISYLIFSQIPLYSSVILGNTSISEIGMHDAGPVPIWVNITAPILPIGTISLSSTDTYIISNQTVFVDVLFSPYLNASAGSYTAQFGYNVTAVGGSTAQASQFMVLKVKPGSNNNLPIVLRSTSLVNYSKDVLTEFDVYNPTNRTIYGSVLTTEIPVPIVQNISNITLGGAINNVSLFNNNYVLKWTIPVLQAGSTALLAYSISNVSSPNYFFTPMTTLTMPTNASQASRFRIFDIQIPTFYVNKPGQISVGSIYTGVNETNITITLAPPLGVVVKNQLQTYKAFPNTVFYTTYNISAIKNSGTYIFQLFVSGPFANQSYTLPVIVLLNQTVVQPPKTTQGILPGAPVLSFLESYTVPVAVAAIIVILGIIAYMLHKANSGQRYNKQRAERLVRLKQRLKREFEE